MVKYYTRACNFYFGQKAKEKIKEGKALPLNNNHLLSFDTIEIITRKFKKKIHIKEIKNQSFKIRKKVLKDIKLIKGVKKFKGLNLKDFPILMGIINLTPDSFSDGGKYNKKNSGFNYAKNLIKKGCQILDLGGESTRPGAKDINPKIEWRRIWLVR